MAEIAKSERSADAVPAFANVLAGAMLGALLSLLVGLSASPVVSIVVTSLVGLLAGFFGFSDTGRFGVGRQALLRITALCAAAIFVLPVAVWVRTHDLLSPSLTEQRKLAEDLGYADNTVAQRDFISFMRYGRSIGGSDVVSAAPAEASVLYSGKAQSICDNLMQAQTTSDVTSILENSNDPDGKQMAQAIAKLPSDDQRKALAYAKIFLCRGE